MTIYPIFCRGVEKTSNRIMLDNWQAHMIKDFELFYVENFDPNKSSVKFQLTMVSRRKVYRLCRPPGRECSDTKVFGNDSKICC